MSNADETKTESANSTLVRSLLMNGYYEETLNLGGVPVKIRTLLGKESDAVQLEVSRINGESGLFLAPSPQLVSKVTLAAIIQEIDGKPILPSLPDVTNASLTEIADVIKERKKALDNIPEPFLDQIMRKYVSMLEHLQEVMEGTPMGES